MFEQGDQLFERYSSDLKPISCESCGKTPPKLLRCNACKAVKYCNAECQLRHWRPCHKKQCKGAKKNKSQWEKLAKTDLEENTNDATGLYILGLRLGAGDVDVPVNHELACRLYEAAAGVQKPIPGGHPIAMLHLALHYERGLGVEQSHSKAYQLYKSVADHPHPGGEAAKPAFEALSRYHEEGLGGVERSDELHAKYLGFSLSNPETAEEIRHLDKWWETGGREQIVSRMEALAEAKNAKGES